MSPFFWIALLSGLLATAAAGPAAECESRCAEDTARCNSVCDAQGTSDPVCHFSCKTRGDNCVARCSAPRKGRPASAPTAGEPG